MNIEIFYLLLAGFGGGLLAGLLGIGGGVIYILILPIALETAGICEAEMVKYTIANSVFAIFIASFVGSTINFFKNGIKLNEIFRIGIPASIVSILCMFFIVNQDWYSRTVFNVVILVLLSFMLIKMLMKQKSSNKERVISNNALSVIGSVSGMVSALSGLGGGILIVPLLQAFYSMNIIKAKDISLGVITIMAFALSLFNIFQPINCGSHELQFGLIVVPTIMIIVGGVLVGSPIGVWISHKLPSGYIKIIFILLIVSVIIRKIVELT